MGIPPIDQSLGHELVRAARFRCGQQQSVARPIGEIGVDPGGSIKHVHIRRIVRQQDSHHLDSFFKVVKLIINLRQLEAGLSFERPARKVRQGALQQVLSFRHVPQARFAHSQGCLDFPHFGLCLQYLAKLRRGARPVILKKPHHSHVGSSVQIVRIQGNHSLEFAFGGAEIARLECFVRLLQVGLNLLRFGKIGLKPQTGDSQYHHCEE